MRLKLLLPLALSSILIVQPRANAFDFGDLFSFGSDLFDQVLSGDFSLQSIPNILGGVGSLTGDSTLQSLGNLSSTFGGLAGDGGIVGGGDLSGLDPDVLADIQASVDAIPNIYRDIQSDNWGGAVDGIFGLLGDLGIINPQQAPTAEGDGAGATTFPDSRTIPDLDRNASTPIEVYQVGRSKKSAYNLATNDISQLIFSPDGQKAVSDRQKESALTLEVSESSAEKTLANVEESTKLYDYQKKAVEATGKTLENVVKAKESLEALKGIASILGINANQFAVLQAQGIIDSANFALSVNALKAIAASNKINGDHLTAITVQSAAQTSVLSSIKGELEHQDERENFEQRGEVASSERSASTFILPPGITW